MIEWMDLKTNPPSEDQESVLAFPLISDVGHLYTVSNAAYLLKHGDSHGYTHWAHITPPGPNELAMAMITVEQVRADDARMMDRLYEK